MTFKTTLLLVAILLSGSWGVSVNAQDAQTPAASAEPPHAQADSTTPAPSAEPEATTDEQAAQKKMDELFNSTEPAPVIEPSESPVKRNNPQFTAPASTSVDIDPEVLGIAPGDDPPPLRREGEFIFNRRGRMIRSPESGHRLFVLESDASHSPELPLVLQACQILETMESIVERRGDTTVFILSGQVHTYRGANYLLPTMMNTAANTGNLTN